MTMALYFGDCVTNTPFSLLFLMWLISVFVFILLRLDYIYM